jgi:hypothetical protein
VGSQDKHERLRATLLHSASGLYTIHDGHGDVHQDQVRARLLAQLEGFETTGGFTDNLEVWL